MSQATKQLAESASALKAVFANPNLRRLQLAWAGSNLGTWAYGIALAVYAYDKGGAVAVGFVGLIRWIPAAVAAPFMGLLGDRYPRRRVMIASDLGRVVVVGLGAAAIVADMPPGIVYALAAIGVVISTAFRPAQAAIIPRLAQTPQELSASNVVSSTIEALGMFAGPAIGGVVLAIGGAELVFAAASLTFLWSAALIALIRTEADTPTPPSEGEEHPSFMREAVGGFSTILREPKLRLLMGLFSAQTLIAGSLSVLMVVVAFELLGKPEAWLGVLSSALGIGGAVGAVVSAALISRNRLAIDFGFGILLWGFPLIAIGIWPQVGVALLAMAAVGLGNTLVDVSGFTLLQRSVPDEVLARVFGVLETLFLLTIAIGAIVTPPIVHLAGARGSLIGIGAFLPILIVLSWRRLRVLDAEGQVAEREVKLLRGISFFSVLPEPVVEHLAGRIVRVPITVGETVFEQGAPGDRFYVVASGRVEIVRDGVPVALVEPGGYFGEIALLHEVPRQAGAVVRAAGELLVLEGGDFVAAVTGHAPSREAAASAIRSYGIGSALPK